MVQRIKQLRFSWPNRFSKKILLPLQSILVSYLRFAYVQPKIIFKVIFSLCKKCPNRSFFWSVFSRISAEFEIYSVNIRIQSEYGKIQTRKNSISGHFSRSVWIVFPVIFKALDKLIFIIILKHKYLRKWPKRYNFQTNEQL